MWSNISLFWFAFHWWLVMFKTTFSRTWWPFVCLLWKDIYSVFMPFFFSSFYGHIGDMWKFLGQGSNQSCSWGLCHISATPDLNHVCDPHHHLWRCWILNPLSKARDWSASSWRLCWVLNLARMNAWNQLVAEEGDSFTVMIYYELIIFNS